LTLSRLGVVRRGFTLGSRLEQNLSALCRFNDLFPGRKLRIQFVAIQLLLYVATETVPNFYHFFLVIVETDGIVGLNKFSYMSGDPLLVLIVPISVLPLNSKPQAFAGDRLTLKEVKMPEFS
jgi:hypothetical protein